MDQNTMEYYNETDFNNIKELLDKTLKFEYKDTNDGLEKYGKEMYEAIIDNIPDRAVIKIYQEILKTMESCSDQNNILKLVNFNILKRAIQQYYWQIGFDVNNIRNQIHEINIEQHRKCRFEDICSILEIWLNKDSDHELNEGRYKPEIIRVN